MMIGAVKEEVSCCFNMLTTITHRGYDTQSWKLCLNLWSPKWFSPSRNLSVILILWYYWYYKKKNSEYLHKDYSIQILLQEKRSLWKNYENYFDNFLYHRRHFLEELAEKDTREIFYKKFCKINIIFLTSVSILRILSLIIEKVSQKMYLLLLQLSLWLRCIE